MQGDDRFSDAKETDSAPGISTRESRRQCRRHAVGRQAELWRACAAAQEHGHGRIIFKMNALADPDVIRHLYRASQAGIQIDLIIRGVCCLRPGVAGVSENIRVRSLVGRFLEHSRVYYFRNNGEEEIYLGSADMMQRNLNTRVEVLFPIDSQKLRTRLIEHLLLSLLKDTANSHELQSDGCYKRIGPRDGEEAFDCQSWFISHPLFKVDNDEDVSNKTISAIPSSA